MTFMSICARCECSSFEQFQKNDHLYSFTTSVSQYSPQVSNYNLQVSDTSFKVQLGSFEIIHGRKGRRSRTAKGEVRRAEGRKGKGVLDFMAFLAFCASVVWRLSMFAAFLACGCLASTDFLASCSCMCSFEEDTQCNNHHHQQQQKHQQQQQQHQHRNARQQRQQQQQ